MLLALNSLILKSEMQISSYFAYLNERCYAFAKRSMDIVFSSLALVLCAPLMIFIAILVKITSAGPVFYKQQRCTKTGRVFWLYKFRSMPNNIEAHKNPQWGKTDDPRCTKFGKALRILLIDELPQFVNVLKGDMSLVGPRPERPYFIEKFKNSIENYNKRLEIKAGLTGWAQVNGYRGNTSVIKRVEYDIDYIAYRSIFFDLMIMLMTPFSIKLFKSTKNN